MRSGQVQFEDDLKPLMVPIDEVKQHPENANNGDVDALAESIMINGMYRAIYVARDGNEIFAGNTTWQACKELGAEVIPVIWSDGDYLTNVRRMLADNKIAQLARMDEGQLLILLSELESNDSLPGTGYADRDVAQIKKLAEVRPNFETDYTSWPTLCFQVPPHLKSAFYDLTEEAFGDRERLELLLRMAGWDGPE